MGPSSPCARPSIDLAAWAGDRRPLNPTQFIASVILIARFMRCRPTKTRRSPCAPRAIRRLLSLWSRCSTNSLTRLAWTRSSFARRMCVTIFTSISLIAVRAKLDGHDEIPWPAAIRCQINEAWVALRAPGEAVATINAKSMSRSRAMARSWLLSERRTWARARERSHARSSPKSWGSVLKMWSNRLAIQSWARPTLREAQPRPHRCPHR